MEQQEFLNYLQNKNINLTEEQKKAVVTVNGPVQVVAVPGSGKTTVLICRVANLILVHNVNPNKILALTFSKASTFDMRDRFNQKFKDIIKEKVRFSTIHAFAFSVVRRYSLLIHKKYTLIEGVNSSITRNKILSNIYKKYNNEPINKDKLEELSGFISYIRNTMIPREKLDNYKKEFPIPYFLEVYEEYNNVKRENSLIDFDDMLVLCYVILKKIPKLLNSYREKYDYIMLDEAQDTSKIQYAIVRLIAYPKCNIFVCGDDDQAIYEWRGASFEEFINFKDKFKDCKVLFMQQNFRSTKSIVNAANEFVKINKNRFNKNMFTNNQDGEKIEIVSVNNEFDQINYLVIKFKEESNLRENAVLFRNNISAVLLVNEFIKNNIPFFIKDTVPYFFNHWVTNDILSFFDFSYDLGNVYIFNKIYYKMKSYVSKQEIQYLWNSDERSVFHQLMNSDDAFSIKNKKFEEFYKKFKNLSKMRPVEGISYIEDELNYKEYLKDYAKKYNYSIDSLENILTTLKMIAVGCEELSQFKQKLDSIQEKMINSKKFRNENVVILSSMHSSKGLEFDKVYCIDLLDDIIPTPVSIEEYSKGDKAKIYEEARLFYVAMTRARKNLFLVYPVKREDKSVKCSRYVNRVSKIINSKYDNVAKVNNTIINYNAEHFKVTEGMSIKHAVFGEGQVVKINGDYITVNFTDNNTKTLSLNTCMNKGIIIYNKNQTNVIKCK